MITPKLKASFLILILLLSMGVMAQSTAYRFQAKINGVTANWHTLRLPNSLFDVTKAGLEDVRIYGFKGTDTIEIPYMLEKSADQTVERETNFTLLNQSHSNDAYYFTFEANQATIINQIRLSFKQDNFDWKASLQGSADNRRWFTILTDQRLLAIKNQHTDYRFTQLDFPASKYRYFRLQIKASEQPELNAAKILKADTLKGISEPIPYQTFKTTNDHKKKLTTVDIDLATVTPLTSLKLAIQTQLDFYRPIKISYAVDSVQTDRGIQYPYIPLFEGTLSSFQAPQFSFNGVLVRKIRCIIENHDNEPLEIRSADLHATVYELIARFKDPSYRYQLYFGNAQADAPVYDLKNFENKIPIGISSLTLDKSQDNPTFVGKENKPFFESNYWIWGLIVLIMLILSFFTFKLLREAK